MHPRDILAILVLTFYAPTLLASLFLLRRHGFRQSWESWFVLTTFALTRLLWGALQLAGSAHPATSRAGYRLAAATLAVDGLSPLLLCALGLLRRLREGVVAGRLRAGRKLVTKGVVGAVLVPRVRLWVLEALVTAAFVCASVAYRGLSEEEALVGPQRHGGTARAAAVLYVVAFVGIAVGAAALVGVRGEVERGERKALVALGGSLPLLGVRVLYLVLDILAEERAFSAITGSVGVFAGMALVEEAVVAAWFLGVGFTVRVIPRSETLALRKAEKRAVEKEEEEGEGVEVGDAALWERSTAKLADEEDGRMELDGRERVELDAGGRQELNGKEKAESDARGGQELDGRTRAELA
ncbi:uncharacterized protein BKCO1_500078 [Diplodia corticola]|uniref:DUF7702 domain-containing protein n=1 Tax=Diplodia corticola TaxID=236234 RepID=A0A1J9SEJ2_9PEZI|nr:uncharacterized protein BKCO1_500078 [Diplodia corticola]OJD37997.1 hypothetical protein BKCO1_500078 [Diplodia corticola]